MKQTSAAPNSHRAIGTAVVGLTIAAAVLGITANPTSSWAPSFSHILRGDHSGATSIADGAATEADGVLPDGVTVFDTRYPGAANLDPELLGAVRDAATEAAEDGVKFHVNSGWRSPSYQNQILRDAVAEYGSEAEAARWVATAATSAHVRGDAVDIGPSAATAWLSEHGAGYGLCQIYGNEPWHYELRPEAGGSRCPRMYTDPTHDPRMQQQ